jgi:ABC-type transporter MlaC component
MRFVRPDSANGRISGHKLGLVMGGVLACWHVMWAGLVLIGWGQPVLDFIFWLHFIEPPYRVGAFVPSRAAGLVVVTATMGYVLGHVAAGLWNATKGGRLPTKGTAMLLMVLAVLPAFVGTAAGSATDDLRRAVETRAPCAVRRATGASGEQGRALAAPRMVMPRAIDFPDAARGAIAVHWSARTPEERDEFIGLFTDLVIEPYAVQLDGYGVERVVFVGESADGDIATVQTRVDSRQRVSVPVDYECIGVTRRQLSSAVQYGHPDEILRGADPPDEGSQRRLTGRATRSTTACHGRRAGTRCG